MDGSLGETIRECSVSHPVGGYSTPWSLVIQEAAR